MYIENIKKQIQEFIVKNRIKFFYLKNKNKGITLKFSSYLFNHKLKELIKDINKSKTKKELDAMIKSNINKNYYHDFVNISLLLGSRYNIYNFYLDNIRLNVAKRYLNNNINYEENKQIIEKYKYIILDYIKNNNSLKNELIMNSSDGTVNLNKEIDIDSLNKYIDISFQKQNNLSINDSINTNIINKIIVYLETLYLKEILFCNEEFVKFEIEHNYFNKYIELLKSDKTIPSLEERLNTYNKFKKLTSDEIEKLNNIELLEQRIKMLNTNNKNELIALLNNIKKENDLETKLELLENCYSEYEIAYREEIVNSLFCPTVSKEITDYNELQPIMIHTFIRDSSKILDSYVKKIKEDIISQRKSKNDSNELTKEEQDLLNKKIEYANKVLLNPTVIEDTADLDLYYSDSSGFRSYISNTSNQISTSIISEENIINMEPCIGIGFDEIGLSFENIAISSSNYQTTNMGLEHLEINNENEFEKLSSSLEELKQSNRNEIVLFRKNVDSFTKSSYIFVIFTGNIKSNVLLSEAEKLAEENNMKLIIFNIPEIKKSMKRNLIK